MSLRSGAFVAVAAATAVCGFAVPGNAAGKTATLYFNDLGRSTPPTCTPRYVLTKQAPVEPNSYCGNTRAGAEGSGELAPDFYKSVASATGFTLDSARPVTGTVYLAGYAPLTVGAGPAESPRYTPGPEGARITITVNGVQLPSVSGSGVELPNATYAIPVNLKLPSSLSGKVVRRVDVNVQYTDGATYVGGVSRDRGSRSKLIFPTR